MYFDDELSYTLDKYSTEKTKEELAALKGISGMAQRAWAKGNLARTGIVAGGLAGIGALGYGGHKAIQAYKRRKAQGLGMHPAMKAGLALGATGALGYGGHKGYRHYNPKESAANEAAHAILNTLYENSDAYEYYVDKVSSDQNYVYEEEVPVAYELEKESAEMATAAAEAYTQAQYFAKMSADLEDAAVDMYSAYENY